MLKFNLFYFFIFQIFWSSSAFSNSYLRPEHLVGLQYSCYLDDKAIVFCSDKEIAEPHIRVRLPLFEPIVLANGIKAFRVMATIENNTKRNLSGAKVNLSFGEGNEHSLDILISEKIIYKATSTTKKSHLIRSDVPINLALFDKLDHIYRSADVSKISIAVKELIFEEL